MPSRHATIADAISARNGSEQMPGGVDALPGTHPRVDAHYGTHVIEERISHCCCLVYLEWQDVDS